MAGTIWASLGEGAWMFYEVAWALALGFALSGAVQAFTSKREMQAALGDHRARTVAKASLLGMASSSCSYAASALAKSLFSRGADFTTAMIFMFASTNLVIELGAVMWLLLGWQFAAAEFVGGTLMIALLAVILPRVEDAASLLAARARLNNNKPAGGSGRDEGETDAAAWTTRVRHKAGWSDAAGYTISDLSMLRKELIIGFALAGFASMAVPTSVWAALFTPGHGAWSAVENAAVGPVLAFISFVCSIGNVPLAAALWKGGISFGGVIAFVFADLLAAPLVLIYRKYYGTALAIKVSLVFWAVMSAAGLLTQVVFSGLNLIPATPAGNIATTGFGLNYTTVLNAVAALGLAYLYWLHKNAAKFGGGTSYAQDVVCGMQVRTADAPARTRHEGRNYWFCSERCQGAFSAHPGKYATAGGPVGERGGGEADIDPVCGMSVKAEQAGGHVTYDGHTYAFCATGCLDDFTADPGRYLNATNAR